jgi:hypothetical protein
MNSKFGRPQHRSPEAAPTLTAASPQLAKPAVVRTAGTEDWLQTQGLAIVNQQLKRKQASVDQLLSDVAKLSNNLSCSQAELTSKSEEVDMLNKRVHWMGVILKSIVSENGDSLKNGVLGQLMKKNQQSILNCAAGDIGFLIDDICTPSKRAKASE